MAKFLKLILAIAAYTCIVSVISLIICLISKEDSQALTYFSRIAFYGTIITFYTLLFHLFIVFMAFMAKFSKLILTIASYTCIVSIVSLIICFISKEDSPPLAYFSGIAFYGTMITIYTLLFHLLIVFISFIMKIINHHDNK